MRVQDLLAEEIDGTRAWTLKLAADIKGDDWSFQPDPGMAHPLWICGHLACSQDALAHVRCLGRGVLDEAFAAHFPIGAPVRSFREHAYPKASEVLEVMADVHAKTLDAIRSMTDATLSEPAYGADGKSVHPHYRDKRGAIVHCLRHEAFHAGQLASIRRLLGKPFLR